MSLEIFNRAEFEHPADGWYQIELKGIHLNAQAGIAQVIDDSACNAIVNRFNADADAGKLSHGREMLIDHDHFKHYLDKETAASGWLTRLQKRADGIYGKIRWTATGQAAVDGGDYRFFSTEYDPKDLVAVGERDPPQVRPMRLDGLTLTNQPNNKGAKAITNRRTGPLPDRAPESHPSCATQAKAAKRITELAEEEQRSSGATMTQSWIRVMNREKPLCDLALGKPAVRASRDKPREVREDSAVFASKTILRLAQERKAPGFSANLTIIRNRFPRLARMANREVGWDALSDLEPVARAAYLEGSQNPANEHSPELDRLLRLMRSITIEFPDLGNEGRWQKLKEVYPQVFWTFVATFDPAAQRAAAQRGRDAVAARESQL